MQAIPAPGGGFVIADQVNFRVRKVAPDGTITTLAGTGTQASTGDGGPATSATLAAPSGLAFLPDGSLLIAEANGNRIRKIATNGTISTVVGTGAAGFSGDNGPATAAKVAFPYDIGVYADGSYVIVDQDNNRIRYISAAGTITTFGSTGTAGALNDPAGLSITSDGSILIADTNNNRIRRAYANGTITTIAGTGSAGFTGDGGPAINARLNLPNRVQALADGGYLIADRNNHRIRLVAADGTISTIAGDGTAAYGGDGGPATSAQINQPVGVSIMPNNDILVTDTFNQRIRLVDESEDAVVPPPSEPLPPPPDIPPPPPPPVERNVKPPTISEAGVTYDNPTYTCTTGTWEGLAANPQYKYEWHVISTLKDSPFGSLSRTIVQTVGTSQRYTLSDAQRGAKFNCVVSARTGTGNIIAAASATRTLSGVPKFDTVTIPGLYGDIRVSGIDVFQASQPSAGSQRFRADNPNFPAVCGGGTPSSFHPRLGTCGLATLDATGPQRTAYVGNPIDGGQPATAIVYVTAKHGAAFDPNQLIDVTLRGRLGGKLITDGGIPTAQVKNPTEQEDPTGVTANEREKIGVQIQIPNSWLQAAGNTDKLFDLEATVALAPSTSIISECDSVSATTTTLVPRQRHATALDNIGVWSDLAHLYISPLAMLDRNQTRSTFADPYDNLKAVREMYPGGHQITVGPWRGEVSIVGAAELTAKAEICEDAKLPVRDCRQQAIEVRVEDYLAKERDGGGYDLIMGVHRYPTGDGFTEPGWQPSKAELGEPGARFEVNDGSINRPLTATAHEFTHAMRIPHADTAAPEPLTGNKCGGGVGGFGEPWPPGNFGRLEGVAFGRYSGGERTATVEVDKDTKAGALFDLMSYCSAGDRTAWLSPYNWTRVFDALRAYKTKVGSRSAAGDGGQAARATVTGQGYVVGTVTPNGIVIERVVPADQGNEVPAPDPGSPVQVTALGASGQPVGTVGATVSRLSDSDTPVSTFIAPLPAGAAAVTATSGANTDRVERSKPPTLKLLAPRTGTRVGGTKGSKLGVRWTARDPDGDPLQVTIDYAPDGRAFRPVYQGPSTGQASLSGDLFSASRKGRVRVTVNDGFNQARAVSGTIVAAGRAPQVDIATPGRKAKLTAGIRTVLTGQATDDAGRSLTGKSLTWFAGSKRLGTGNNLRVALPPGSTRLRLVARDRSGRTGTAAQVLKVAAVGLVVDRVDAPARVKPKVKTVTVTALTSTLASLRIGGRNYAIGPKAKKLKVKLPAKPATGALKLAYTVTAVGSKQKAQRGVIIVLRV